MKTCEQNRPGVAPLWLDEYAAAVIIGLSVSTLRRDRHRHQGLPYYKVGRAVRYSMADIVAFMAARRVDPNAGGDL